MKIGISDTEKMLHEISKGCRPGQYVRELVVNAIQAIGRSRVGHEITADEDPAHPGMFAVIDDGPGMSEALLHEEWDLFYKSGASNFGVGGKIASVARGSLLVRTWQNGQGVQLTLDRSGRKVIQPIGDQHKPALIEKHGTIVTILGKDPDDRTAAVPADALGGAGWVLKYLNTKFFELPNGVTIRGLGGKGLERAHGLSHYLFKFAADSGRVTLRESGFVANWFLLPKGRDEDKGTPYAQLRNYTTLTGSISLLFENELYNSQSVREAEGNPLRPFGIYTGGNRVAIMLRPLDPSEYEPTLQRSMLEKRVTGGIVPVPIGSIAAEFASQIPQKLKVFMADRDAKSQMKKDGYLDKKLYDVHGFDLVEWQNGKVRRPANGGKRVPFAPRPEPGNSANVAPSPAEEEASDQARPSLPPPDLEDGRVTASVGANKNFHRRRDLPPISVHSADDLPADTWAEYMDSDARRLSINRSWAGLGGHLSAVARRQGFPATDAQKDQIITRLIHNSKDGILTAYEQLAAKVIRQEKFTELIGPLGLTAAACPRSSLVNYIHAGDAPESQSLRRLKGEKCSAREKGKVR